MTTVGWFICSIAAYVVGEIASKEWSLHPSFRMFFLAVSMYALCAAFWLPALERVQKLAVLGTIWAIAYVIADIAVGVGAYGETLTRTELCGIILGVISITLLCV